MGKECDNHNKWHIVHLCGKGGMVLFILHGIWHIILLIAAYFFGFHMGH